MQIKIDGSTAYLTAPSNSKLMIAVSGLEGPRKWIKTGHLRFEPTGHNIDRLKLHFPELQIENKTAPEPVAGPSRGAYQSRTKPHPHQEKALAMLDGRRSFALFLEQGTGKTKVAIDWAGRLYASGLINAALVVSKKGVHRQWIESELPKHFGLQPHGLFTPPTKDWKAAAPASWMPWLAVNYDGLRSGKIFSVVEQFCERHSGRLLIIADESQEIKNSQSARFKNMMKLKPHSSHRLILTGTPIARNLEDQFSQLKWLDENILGIRYVTNFRNHYCVMGGFENRQIVAHKNVEEFNAKVAPHVLRVTKDEIGILPKQYGEWVFDLLPEQVKAMKELKKTLETEWTKDKTITAANAVTALIKMQGVASGFFTGSDGSTGRLIEAEKNPRLNAMQEWLEAGEGKALIWARFREENQMIAERLFQNGVSFATYHGGTKSAARADAVKSFLSPKGVQVLIASQQAAGTGLNLQGSCNRVLYYSNSFSAIDRWQSEDRVHRLGTVGAVVYTDLIASRGLDRHIVRNLQMKKGLSDLVLSELKTILGNV